MPGKDERRTPGEYILIYSGLALIFISFITFLYLIIPDITNPDRITALGDQVSGFSGIFFNTFAIYAIIFLILFFSTFAIFSLFYRNEKLSMGFSEERNRTFFGYLMIYILVQLILSEVVSYFAPQYSSEFPFNQPVPIQNFILSYQSLLEAALYELLPITIAAVILSKIHGTPLLEGLRFYKMSVAEKHVVSVVISAIASALVSTTPMEFITAFFSLLVLNEIFLNFGFLKAFLANFSVELLNIALIVTKNNEISIVLAFFLFFLGFLGVYSLVQMGVRIPGERPDASIPDSVENTHQPPNARKAIQIEPFIRSRCPECGQTTYHIILPNMDMQCAKCGHELDRNAIGETNIVIDIRSPSKF